MAAAGLAVVIAAGFVFAFNSGNESPLTAAQPVAGSTFSVIGGEANQVPAAARVPESDVSLNIEKIRLGLGAGVAGTNFSVIGGEANQVPAAARVPATETTLNIEKYRFELQNAVRGLDIASQRYEEYAGMLANQHAAQMAKQQAMWEQRFDDLVERFENQANGGTGLRPIQGRF